MAEQWTDTPPPKKGSRDWESIAETLREHPGKWLLVIEQASRSTHGSVVRGRIKAVRETDEWYYECRTRNTNGKLADIYMSAKRKKRST
jgi:hypothetical protein